MENLLKDRICAMAISNNGNFGITGSEDYTINLFNLDSKNFQIFYHGNEH